MNRAIFLDRDGTINANTGYVHKIEEFQFIPGTLKAIAELSRTAFKIIIATGQSGIGRGHYSEQDYHKLIEYMIKEIEKNGGRVDGSYFCPHKPDDGCGCRKPKTGMIEKASKEHDIDLSKSWNVGDKTADIKMGENIGCRNILVRTGKGGKDGEFKVNPEYTANDLLDAVLYILSEENA